ncbi:hypothetical protein EG68_00516 [Paragonimus skrjabini miyazakii]|uniref:Hexosyltransferase n=1 Tax=Paragonimus skrjabini miyazakii TaxID=59628 RepID=A0A8S9Z400_9TREM|nr:hypothetical protein EG68_00516 [Paragonimus skrjabini miyazakii]
MWTVVDWQFHKQNKTYASSTAHSQAQIVSHFCNTDKPTFDLFYTLHLYGLYEQDLLRNNSQSSLLPSPLNPKTFQCKLVVQHVCEMESSVNLMILIKTTHTRVNQREQIRKTWAHPFCYYNMGINVRTFFLLGELSPNEDILTSRYIQKSLERENQIYGDLLQFDFVDHYNNNTYKLMSALQFAAQHCPQTRFVMIVDDDFLVHPFNLIKSITQDTYFHTVPQCVLPSPNDIRLVDQSLSACQS